MKNNGGIFVEDIEKDLDLDFVIEEKVIKTQVKFNSENSVSKLIQNCLNQIKFLKTEVDELKSKNPSVQSVVSIESPVHELWDNEVDDVWNDF